MVLVSTLCLTEIFAYISLVQVFSWQSRNIGFTALRKNTFSDGFYLELIRCKKFKHLLDQNQILFVLHNVQTHVRSKSVGRGIEFEGALNQLMCEESVCWPFKVQCMLVKERGFQD